MTVYVVNEITVTDPAVFKTYADQVPAILARYGGRYIVRSGAVEAIEGEAPTERIVITAFESREAARAWRNSPEYTAVLPIRNASSTGRVFIIDGYDG